MSTEKQHQKSHQGDATSYHHGNLKQALVETYLAMLKVLNPDKISMRKLASEVGVAPTAVYNHFTNKEELEVAVKCLCLNHFAAYLDTAIAQIEAPSDCIKELGKAYFNYSQEHHQYFQLIMNPSVPQDDRLITQDLMDAGMRAEASVRGAVIRLLDQHGIPQSQYNEGLGAFACWAMAHGISTLAEKKVNQMACAEGNWPPEFMMSTPEQVHSSFDAMTEVLVAGILQAAKKN